MDNYKQKHCDVPSRTMHTDRTSYLLKKLKSVKGRLFIKKVEIVYSFLLVFFSNFVPKTHHF